MFEHEPKIDKAFAKMPNVVLTPHLGSATPEVREAMANIVVDNILAFLGGHKLPNCVNPQVFALWSLPPGIMRRENLESPMPRTVIAVTDSPFPSLDPAKAALARLDPEYRMAKSPSAEDILAVARDADAVLVTYAKLSGQLLSELKSARRSAASASASTISICRRPRNSASPSITCRIIACAKCPTTPWRCSWRWPAR